MHDETITYVIDGIFSLLGLAGGWLMKLVFDEQRDQRERLNDHIEKTSDVYARKSDLSEQFDRVFRTLERIENKVDKS